MEEQRQNVHDLLSGFYTLLWAQLDGLFDEHRWVRAPLKEGAKTRTPEDILEGLSELEGNGLTLPTSINQLKVEVTVTKQLVAKWKDLPDGLKQQPADRGSPRELPEEVSNLHRAIQDKRALFEERAVAFASLLVASTEN